MAPESSIIILIQGKYLEKAVADLKRTLPLHTNTGTDYFSIPWELSKILAKSQVAHSLRFVASLLGRSNNKIKIKATLLSFPSLQVVDPWLMRRLSKPQGRGGTAQTYYLATFLLKTSWKWKNLDTEVACVSGAPPKFACQFWQLLYVFYDSIL